MAPALRSSRWPAEGLNFSGFPHLQGRISRKIDHINTDLTGNHGLKKPTMVGSLHIILIYPDILDHPRQKNWVERSLLRKIHLEAVSGISP